MVGSCHVTLMPSLMRMQIEAVRVHSDYRGMGIGKWMIEEAIAYGRIQGALIIQLSTNKKRLDAVRFYESLGFKASHEGVKRYV